MVRKRNILLLVAAVVVLAVVTLVLSQPKTKEGSMQYFEVRKEVEESVDHQLQFLRLEQERTESNRRVAHASRLIEYNEMMEKWWRGVEIWNVTGADVMDEQIKRMYDPFRRAGITAQQLQRACHIGRNMICMYLRDGKLYGGMGGGVIATDIAALFRGAQTLFDMRLPNADFAVNTLDEVRVIPDPTGAVRHIASRGDVRHMLKERCPVALEEMERDHGPHLTLPESASISGELLPVYGRVSLKGCSKDILFPDWSFIDWHNSHFQAVLAKNKEFKWEDKIENIFWAGSSTGGANVHDFPRVKLTQEGKRLRKIEEEEAMARGDTINKEKPMADIRLTAAIQCEPDGCQVLRNEVGISQRTGNYEPLQHKYALDIEGNSYSIRHRMLLASNSVVFRHPFIYPEFFIEWLTPGKHFVPIKGDFSDLREKFEYARSHDAEMRAIAEEASRFMETRLRAYDVAAYALRLVIEQALLTPPANTMCTACYEVEE